MEWNKVQKEKRESLNYSFEDLKRLTKIPIYRLKDIENWYSYPRKKEKLINALSISLDEYNEENDLHYPYLFNKEEKTSNKLIKVFSSKFTLIISFILSVILLISFALSIKECIPYSYNVTSFYDDKLFEIREDSIKKSIKVDSNYIFTTSIDDNTQIDYVFNENINYISQSRIDYKFNLDTYDYTYSFYSDSFERRLLVKVENIESQATFTYFYYLNYLDEDLVYDSEITDDENMFESVEIILKIEELFLDIYETVNLNLIANYSITLDNYLDYLKSGQYKCYSHESEFYYYSFAIGLGLIISLSVFSSYFIIKYKNNKKDIKVTEIDSKNLKEYKALNKDTSIEPFIKENGLIIFTQLFYFLTSFNLYLIFANAFQVNSIHKMKYIDNIIDILRNCMPLANILILFINLNRKIINNKPLKTALNYLFIWLIFTGLECLLIYDLSRSGDFFINILISFLPKKLFFAMGLYALIYYFLFQFKLQ